MWKSVDEAYRSCVSPAGINLSDAKHVSDKDLTDVDHFLLSVVKQTEGMPDSERIKYLHHSVSCILPYLQEHRRAEYSSQRERIDKLGAVLAEAYLDFCEENMENRSKSFENKLRNFSLEKFSLSEWDDLYEIIGRHVPREHYSADTGALYDIAMKLKQFDAIKNAAERGK